MVVSSEKKEIQITLDGKLVEQFSHFQYLGVMLEEPGKQQIKFNKQTEMANKLYVLCNETGACK